MGSLHTYNGLNGDGRGKKIIKLLNYTSFGRHHNNWHGRPMKKVTFLASLLCWRACWPYLTEVSRRSPPTYCHVPFYYSAFKSHMGQHRDNSDVNCIKKTIASEFSKLEGHPFGGGEKSQVVCSNVLVLTMRNKPMNLIFNYPKKGENNI